MIKVLEKQIADKIAAGEVIERPASIIKELVENSIDSGATSIFVEIKNGGKTYIRVTDNGSGIKKDEIETAFLRHATSKISKLSDLNSIDTLGFRGEALASIVAVSRTEVLSKTIDQKTGTRLIIHGDEIISKEDVGTPDGTTIIVRDLFYNTPARLKFLKGDNVETSQIVDLLSCFALCYKDIKFRFDSNDVNIFNTLGDGNRLNVISRVYNDLDTKNLIEVFHSFEGIKITGYTSSPILSKNNRSSEIFFVNGRVVNSKVIEKGINLAYKERLFDGRFPVCFLFLEVDPKTIDVNIHPNKKEVRFDDEALISNFIYDSLVIALNTNEGLSNVSNIFIEKEEDFTNLFDIPSNDIKQVDLKSLLSTKENDANIVKIEEPLIDEDILIQKPIYRPFDFKDLTVTGSLFNTYITCIYEDYFYLIDQHAAQERIFYEKLVNQYDSLEKDTQTLMFPIVIDSSIKSSINEESWISKLRKMGFNIENFGNMTYRISEIPMFMELSEAETFVKEYINNINDSIDLRNTVVVNKLITMSCKASIKANDKLTLAEMNQLLKDLSNCINPFSCPHGRPTVVKLSKYEIEKMFKRV